MDEIGSRMPLSSKKYNVKIVYRKNMLIFNELKPFGYSGVTKVVSNKHLLNTLKYNFLLYQGMGTKRAVDLTLGLIASLKNMLVHVRRYKWFMEMC